MKASEPLILNIRISDNHSKILEIYDDDDMEQVVETFCRTNGIGSEQKRMLYASILAAYDDEDKSQNSKIEEESLEYEDYEIDQSKKSNQQSEREPLGRFESGEKNHFNLNFSKKNQNTKQKEGGQFDSEDHQDGKGQSKFEEQLQRTNARVKFVESEQKEQVAKIPSFRQTFAPEAVFEKPIKNYQVNINSPSKGIKKSEFYFNANVSKITQKNLVTENSEQYIGDQDLEPHFISIPQKESKQYPSSNMSSPNFSQLKEATFGAKSTKLLDGFKRNSQVDNRIFQNSDENDAGHLKQNSLTRSSKNMNLERKESTSEQKMSNNVF
jgi:hypothetical protein